MSSVNLVAANLASVPIESFLYGVFVVLFITSSYLLVGRARESGKGIWFLAQSPLFIASNFLFVTITAHWVLTVFRSFRAFYYLTNGNPLDFYADLSEGTEVSKVALSTTVILIGDALLVYRLWIVYNRSKLIIIVPLFTFLGALASSIGVVYMFVIYVPGQNVFVSGINGTTLATCVCTLITNITCSGAIALRLWRSHKAVPSRLVGGHGGLIRVLSILIESAALYVSWTIVYLSTYESQSNVQFTTLDAWCPISGIAFMLINVRVALRPTLTSERSTSHAPRGLNVISAEANSYGIQSSNGGGVKITVEAVRHRDGDIEMAKIDSMSRDDASASETTA